jgi:hypothetical protein
MVPSKKAIIITPRKKVKIAEKKTKTPRLIKDNS